MFMLYWSSRVKSVLILNIAYFVTFFVKKCLAAYLDRAKKNDKSLKIENFDQTSEKQTPLNIADNFDQTHRCPLFRGLTVYI